MVLVIEEKLKQNISGSVRNAFKDCIKSIHIGAL